MQETVEVQQVPVKVYRSAERLTVATPMPGLGPEDITVEVTADGYLVLDGQLRAGLRGEKELLASEWSVGPYRRSLALPVSVDGTGATVTYGNGVLVVSHSSRGHDAAGDPHARAHGTRAREGVEKGLDTARAAGVE